MIKDFKQKIRLNNILLSLGYYTRLEVKLAEYSIAKNTPMELTDLDVLGIRISPDFKFDYTVIDCTSSNFVIKSPIQRVFWLKGVMELFGSSKGYLVLDTRNLIQEIQRQVSTKLGITILDEKNLLNFEKRLLDEKIPNLKIADPNSWLDFENKLSSLDNKLNKILRYRKYNYWINKHNQNILAIITIFSRYKDLLDENNKIHKALSIDLLSLLCISILDMAKFVFDTNPERATQELRAYFFGGYNELKNKEKILENIKKLIENQNQKKLFYSNIKLDPDYLEELFEIVFRWVNKPLYSTQIPRYLQATLFEKVLYNNNIGNTYIEKYFPDIIKKMSRDIATLIINKCNIPEKMFSGIFN